MTNSPIPIQNQCGATLIVALVMLLLISLLAVGGMQSSILQERMASNAHDGSIAFQASEAALRQAETDLLNIIATRQAASGTARLATPWDWDGISPASSGVGNVGTQVNSEPVYHHARLADICPIDPTEPCFERFVVTSRGEGGSPDAIAVLQSTVLLPPE
ncbi:pilus assembly PilX family protein [Marinobacter alexandrii]|uniref:pilus assembly PilX family protein n=1 Tax=Marinobacter alexandrii TaxID=2570351 RepID=UPI001108FECF|nr:PilX N-terminal domain-containing pilus assembly protein [Marinobacter alexandrii]